MIQLLASREEMGRLAQRMRTLAETDSLTSLPNRYLLTETVRRLIGRGGAVDRLALLFIDLDNFKRINDALGHETGDELLQNVARRLTKTAGKERLLARVGGDEFVLVVDGMGAAVRAQSLAQSIIDAFELAFGLRGNSYVIRVSVGIATYTDSDDAEYDLLRQADLAMYAAKGEGKPANVSKSRVYTPDLSTRAMRDIERQQELQYAILNGEFFLEYQPIVSLSTGEIRGIEALARWRHPEKGTVMPADFIPFAESTGFMVPIGELVLEQACAQFSEWQERDSRSLYLSVNVSAAQLVDGNVVRVVHRCLDQYMIDPRRLQLEITETAILEDSVVVTRRLKELRLSGVKVVLDDFGTGYSSLSQLTNLVIDGVKIDCSFTRGVPGDKASLATFNSIATLARELGLSLTVEGVESGSAGRLAASSRGYRRPGILFRQACRASRAARWKSGVAQHAEAGHRAYHCSFKADPLRGRCPGCARPRCVAAVAQSGCALCAGAAACQKRCCCVDPAASARGRRHPGRVRRG